MHPHPPLLTHTHTHTHTHAVDSKGRESSAAASPFLEDTGLALSTSVFRLGYFAGGDGESQLKVDLRNTAGFVRHRMACVTNFLLPIKVRGRGDMRMLTPHVALFSSILLTLPSALVPWWRPYE